MMKHSILIVASLVVGLTSLAQTTHVSLEGLYDAEVFVGLNETGLTLALDDEGRYLDPATLPAGFQDGGPFGGFQFSSLLGSSLDALVVNGQTLTVEPSNYNAIDLALLSAPGGYGDPFGQMVFQYTDGSSDSHRFGPISSWFQSPTAFDNTFYSFTDDSSVETIAAFDADFGEDERLYLLQENGNGDAGGVRFVDGTGFVLYVFDVSTDLTNATLGVTVGNNFVISIATEFFDPETPDIGFEVVANSMEIHDGFEHRALGNLRQYDIDLAPFLAQQTGEIYVLFTDATTANGWGPYIQRISLFQGQTRSFQETLEPTIDASNADVYAMFQTDGGENETPYLYENSASGPSNRGHRFADAGGSLTYQFDLPDTIEDAKLTVDMANNFVVSLAGSSDVVRYAQVSPGTAEESQFLIEEQGSILAGNSRFADGSGFMVYEFDLPDDLTNAFAVVNIGNQFFIEASRGDDDYSVEYDWVFDSGQETRDNSNLDSYPIDLAPYLADNTTNTVRIRLSDGLPADGWGPFLTGITIVNQIEDNSDSFVEVLNSMELFGDDIRNEYNKTYYTIELADVLANNPGKQFSIRFTDGSTGDGWGPGIFWMAVYSGDIDIQTDRLVFDGLKTTLGDPDNYSAAVIQRRYSLNPAKTLQEIVLPTAPDTEDDSVYLMAASLSQGGSSITDWMLR